MMDAATTAHDFDGVTYHPSLDKVRLNAQLVRVLKVMKDGAWRTLREISRETGDPESSVSARLRDFRKDRFGAVTIERRHRSEAERGLHEYRMVLPAPPGSPQLQLGAW